MTEYKIDNKEVSWKVYDIPVFGTITAPANNSPHPTVIFVAGSGPTDRNWNSPLLPGTNGSGKLLAEDLARHDFVTLRYDKVASGPHFRENIPKFIGKISMQSHLEELKGAVETMIAQKNVDKNNLFVLTNSEGAIHAVNYQLRAKSNRFKGIVLTGAPGRAIMEVSRTQILNQVRQLPNAETIMKAYDDAIVDFLADKSPSKDTSLPEGNIKLVIQSLWNPANLPFSRELWNYSLSQYIQKIDEPILVMIGKKDIQVDWKIDGTALKTATAEKNAVSFVYPENANHVLKYEIKPLEEITAQYAALSYNAPNTKLDSEATDTILNWLYSQTQK